MYELPGLNTADKVSREIAKVVRVLEDHPFAGRSRDEIRPGLRSVAASPHVVFYRVTDGVADVVDPTTQSQAFQNALNQAGIYVRRFVIPGDPFEGEIGGYGATAAPTILRFLEGAL